MGGAVGHCKHLYDDVCLTFGELKDVLRLISTGNLDRPSEKVDGMNIVFTWNVDKRRLFVARCTSDVRNGGMDAQRLALKFRDRGDVATAFNEAFDVITSVIETMSNDERLATFGQHGNVWRSAEVVSAAHSIVIHYGMNAVVFHEWPTFNVVDDRVVKAASSDGIGPLSRAAERAVVRSGWSAMGPIAIKMKRMADDSALNSAVTILNGAMSFAGMNDANTINEYVKARAMIDVSSFDVDFGVADAIVGRITKVSGYSNVTKIRKMVRPDVLPIVDAFIASGTKSYIEPIENAVRIVAAAALQNMTSALITSGTDEVVRMRSEVGRVRNVVEASGNKLANEALARELRRLGNTDDISAIEGVVFFYKDKAYKVTGNFSALHHVLTMLTFNDFGIFEESFRNGC